MVGAVCKEKSEKAFFLLCNRFGNLINRAYGKYISTPMFFTGKSLRDELQSILFFMIVRYDARRNKSVNAYVCKMYLNECRGYYRKMYKEKSFRRSYIQKEGVNLAREAGEDICFSEIESALQDFFARAVDKTILKNKNKSLRDNLIDCFLGGISIKGAAAASGVSYYYFWSVRRRIISLMRKDNEFVKMIKGILKEERDDI